MRHVLLSTSTDKRANDASNTRRIQRGFFFYDSCVELLGAAPSVTEGFSFMNTENLVEPV